MAARKEIPGFMPAMTMIFRVSPGDAKVVKQGDRIRARLARDEDGGFRLLKIRVIDEETARVTREVKICGFRPIKERMETVCAIASPLLDRSSRSSRFVSGLLGLGAAFALSTIVPLQALSMNPLELWASDVAVNNGNLSSSFYKVDTRSKESGSAASVFDYAFGVMGGVEFVELSWFGSPQPELYQASLKAGNFHVIWGSSFFAAFNSSLGVYDGIRLYQDGITNSPGKNLLGISHANLEGQLGGGAEGEQVSVPDSGRSLLLVGLGLGFLGLFHRFARK